ncbi:MAG: S1 RNA-binding domain-containing protein [Endomicrobia bacterium]|nr:S1 RNA-binding domain-containing protein [Endomicrobiia bacterium]
MSNQHNNDKNDYIEEFIPEDIYKFNTESIKAGEVVQGKVIEIMSDGIYVDIGSKTDGFIPIEEFKSVKDIHKLFKPQQIIKVYIVKTNYDNVHLLSYKKAKAIEMADKLKESFDKKEPLDALIIEKTEAGYIVDIGVEALLPYREISSETKEKISATQSVQNFCLKVVIKKFQLSPDKNLEIVVSNKLYEEIVKEELKNKLFSSINEGDEIIGTVKNLTQFGAFVDINGVDALLHISNIAWYKLNHPDEVLHCGDKIKVKVLKIDKTTGKIEVGLKQLFPHPWEEVDKKYNIGEIIKGKISNITKFGIFVEIEPAVEGLVHISEISWENKHPDINKIYKVGQEIEAKILDINKTERRISLSVKKMLFNPWEEIKKEFPPGSVHKGRITKITSYGIFVSIKPGFDGIIHTSNISWTKKIPDLHKVYKIGDYLEYKVLEVLPEQETAILSIKHLKENPFNKYPVDTIVKCKIVKILKNLMFVSIEEDVEGIITKKEAVVEQKDFAKELKVLYKPGQQIDAVVIFSDETSRKIELSIRRLEKIIQKQLIKKFSEVQRPTLKDILSEK